jgi:soluble lytic murein transglycosylase
VSRQATYQRRAASRRPARRAQIRRRRLGWLVVLLAVAAGAYALAPSVKDKVREITLPLRHEDIIRQQAREKHLPPELIAGVIYAESKFTDQTSHAGARGLMQVTPETARGIALRTGGVDFRESDLATPQVNISYGSWYLRNLLDRYGGNEVLALAAYNAGQGNVDRWISEARAKGESLTVDAIPFGETRAYVERVLQAERDYRANYAHELGIG